jgi:hypothetical protein
MPEQFWEKLDATDQRDVTSRTKVPGGWIYRNIVWHADNAGLAVSLVFVPEEAPKPPPSPTSAFAVGRNHDRQGSGG